jgi:hypothetical protein
MALGGMNSISLQQIVRKSKCGGDDCGGWCDGGDPSDGDGWCWKWWLIGIVGRGGFGDCVDAD